MPPILCCPCRRHRWSAVVAAVVMLVVVLVVVVVVVLVVVLVIVVPVVFVVFAFSLTFFCWSKRPGMVWRVSRVV